MLERDLITKNIQVLVQLLMRLTGLSMEDPEKALEKIEPVLDESILDKLEKKSGQILLLDDQLVKVHVDLAFLKANILYEHVDKQVGIAALKRVQRLMENYREIFPKNFPFDYYGKMARINQLLQKS